MHFHIFFHAEVLDVGNGMTFNAIQVFPKLIACCFPLLQHVYPFECESPACVPADDPDERQEQDAGAHQQLEYQVEHSGTAPPHLPGRVCGTGQLRSQA